MCCDKEIITQNSSMFFDRTDNKVSDQPPKKCLLIVPDMELNGAQTVLFNMIHILNDLSYELTVISSEDGPYRTKYTDNGIRVIIRPVVSCSELFKEYMRSFDLVLLNSSSVLPYLYFFINTNTHVLLWLHETKQQLQNTGFTMPPPQLLSPNIRIVGVTKAVQRGIDELYDYTIKVLPMPVFNAYKSIGTEARDKTDIARFFIPAGYTYIKGQDILLNTITRLPKDFTDKSHFTFCGYKLPGQEKYYDSIKAIAESLSNVTFLDSLDQSEVYRLYESSDCVVAPSRIDATPTTIVEALMFKKIALVSSNAGISEYLSDCVNAFVFANEDELFKRLLLIISDISNMDRIKTSGYKVYEENFSAEYVKSILAELI